MGLQKFPGCFLYLGNIEQVFPEIFFHQVAYQLTLHLFYGSRWKHYGVYRPPQTQE